MNVEELLQKLRDLRRPSDVLGRTEYFPIINREHFGEVEMLIRQFALDSHDAEIGELKAKVYAYEQIIANSNFAPILIKPKKKTVDIEEEVMYNADSD